MSLLITLFWEFFKIGLFSIGGGLATLPFLYELSNKYQWFSAEMLTNMLAISESTPGPLGVNMATYAGYHTAGFLGGIAATLGLITPSILIIFLVAHFLTKFKNNKYVQSVFYILRPIATGLVISAIYQIAKIILINIEKFQETKQLLHLFRGKELILFSVFLFCIFRFEKSPLFYIVLGAAAGIFLL